MANELTSLDIIVPSIVALNEKNSLRAFTYGTGGSLAAVNIYVIPPLGFAIDITSLFADVSSTFPATFISQFQAEYTFQQQGLYVFILHDTTTGKVWIGNTYCSIWASRLDIPVSDLSKQRSELQRIYTRVK